MRTLFKGGTIYDGTGRRPFAGDVLIEDDRIVKIADNIKDKADNTIDISGYQICPGLIDAHSHNDFFYDRDDAEKFYKPFIEQGITTQITGNCSFSPFGVDEDTPYKDKIGGGLFDTMHPCSFAEFKRRAEGNLYVNLVPLIGQGSVRAGMTGYDPTPYTEEQIEKELQHVREAMEGGAFGGSLGFMYEPDRYAKEDEITHGCKQVEDIMTYAMQDRSHFIKQVFNIDGVETVDLFGCVVARHNIRTQNKYVPVIDIKRMEELLSKYSLNTVFHMIRNHQYEIPLPQEATITHQVVPYAGFEFRIPAICFGEEPETV